MKVDYVTYNGIIMSIPREWKRLLKNESFTPATDENTQECLQKIPFGAGTTKEMYVLF